jgi:HlyD family secretion protein
MANKKKNRKRIIIWIIVGLVVALGVLGYFRWRSRLAAASRTTYDIVSVTRGDIQVTVKGSGSVEPMEKDTVYANSAATVDEVYFENGDTVSAGDVVAKLSSDALETQRTSLQQQIDDADEAISAMRSVSGSDTIYAPLDGTVMAVYATVGESADVVTDRDGALALICPDDLLIVTVSGDATLTPGQKVTVTVGSVSVTGEVTEAADGKATVRFTNKDFGLGASALVTDENGAQIGEGSIAVANPVYIKGRGGEIDKVYTEAGDEVSRFDKLFRLDGEVLSDALYAQIESRADLQDDMDDTLADIDALTVRAGTDGVITGLNLNPGQAVQGGLALFAVQSNGDYKIDVDIDELDIAGIELGESAAVKFDALPDQTFTATVDRINPVGTSVNNVTTYTVTLALSDAPGVMLGMSADVTIVSESAQDVLLIPIEAIQVVGGNKYVIFEGDVDPEASSVTATHPVTTGITDGVNIEIKEGLSEGDKIAVPRVSETNVQEQMMGMRPNAQSDKSSAQQSEAATQ